MAANPIRHVDTTNEQPENVNLQEFAASHRLKTKLDKCGETIIPGKRGASHIFEYGNWPGENSPSTMAVIFMADPHGLRKPGRQWNKRRAAMLDAGFQITQDCDGEGTARFDPNNPKQVKLAIRVAGIRPKQIRSEAQQLVAAKGLAAARLILRGPANTGPFAA